MISREVPGSIPGRSIAVICHYSFLTAIIWLEHIIVVRKEILPIGMMVFEDTYANVRIRLTYI